MQETLEIVPPPDPADKARYRSLAPVGRGTGVSPSERERLVRLAYRVLWRRADAEDAVQEALLAGHQKADQLRDDARRWSWLCRIVIQKCYEQGRQQQRRTRLHQACAARGGGGPIELDPSLPAQRADLKEWVRLAILKLSPRRQQVLVLKDLEGMSYDEVAQVLEIAPATARVHARDAREALRQMLESQHPAAFGCESSEHVK